MFRFSKIITNLPKRRSFSVQAFNNVIDNLKCVYEVWVFGHAFIGGAAPGCIMVDGILDDFKKRNDNILGHAAIAPFAVIGGACFGGFIGLFPPVTIALVGAIGHELYLEHRRKKSRKTNQKSNA